MSLQASKLSIMQKIMSVDDNTLLKRINALLDEEMVVAYTVDGKPLTKEMYEKRLQKAELQLSKGEFISQEDLEKESENW